MTVTALPDTEADSMNCMEIHGGSGSACEHFSRPGLDIWLTSQSHSPSADGGKDVYLLSSCASGRITRLLLADVCSLGSEFATPAAGFRDVMENNINTVRQTRCVREIDERLYTWSQDGSFATVLLSTYFSPTRSLALCNVGNALPLLYRKKSKTWSTLKQTSTSLLHEETTLGVVGRDEYQELVIQLDLGDIFVNYSSALTECRDQHGRLLGTEGILSRVQELDTGEPAVLGEQLINGIRSEHDENLAEEDATVVVGRVASNRVSWRDNLLALFRYFTGPVDKTRHQASSPI